MFPHLAPPLGNQLPEPEKLGRLHGPMDGGLGPDPAQDNPRIPAGFTYLGQFIDHDITFDPTSIQEKQIDPNAVWNFRTPYLELDSLYGGGPRTNPYLYDQKMPGRFITGPPFAWPTDLPRTWRGAAIIGDPRNDENLIVSQIHLAFLRFHNRLLDQLEPRSNVNGRFEEARRLVRWHYQWIVLHEFLPLVCGEAVVQDILQNGREFYRFQSEPFIPLEFSVAAYRFGHSMIRPAYTVNDAHRGVPLFREGGTASQRVDLRGGVVTKDWVVDWSRFFQLPGKPGPQKSLRIDTKLSRPLLSLPTEILPSGEDGPRSLPVRNLRRGMERSLPSGQAVALLMGDDVLSERELWEGTDIEGKQAPLWFYILREAFVRCDGQTLGPVGGRIVAEVLIGLLQGDPHSFLSQRKSWRPELPSNTGGKRFAMADLLFYASGG
jgi:heme peroxidase